MWKATDLCESFELAIVRIGLETYRSYEERTKCKSRTCRWGVGLRHSTAPGPHQGAPHPRQHVLRRGAKGGAFTANLKHTQTPRIEQCAGLFEKRPGWSWEISQVLSVDLSGARERERPTKGLVWDSRWVLRVVGDWSLFRVSDQQELTRNARAVSLAISEHARPWPHRRLKGNYSRLSYTSQGRNTYCRRGQASARSRSRARTTAPSTTASQLNRYHD